MLNLFISFHSFCHLTSYVKSHTLMHKCQKGELFMNDGGNQWNIPQFILINADATSDKPFNATEGTTAQGQEVGLVS